MTIAVGMTMGMLEDVVSNMYDSKHYVSAKDILVTVAGEKYKDCIIKDIIIEGDDEIIFMIDQKDA